MKITPKKIHRFMVFKLPLAYLAGVRIQSLQENVAVIRIKHKWMNQNPFKSMFWAAQGMAAEMSTGVLVMQEIAASDKNVSMLVTHQNATFFKKAIGTIVFTCNSKNTIKDAIQKSIQTKEGQLISLVSEGINEEGILVSRFEFEWSLKVKY